MSEFSTILLNPDMLVRADRLVSPGSWVGHIPFAMWLMKTTSPVNCVELGTHTGNSYFAFCQSVESNGLKTQCYAVDTWQGDIHAGLYDKKTVLDEVTAYNKRYAGFSKLLCKTFDEALLDFNEGEVELLHIDGLHTYEAVKHDFLSWLPKMSSRGVVLFHDVTVTKKGFGVGKLWRELKKRYPSFLFEHSNGLGVLAVGKQVHQNVMELCAESAQQQVVTRNIFEMIGASHVQQLDIDLLRSQLTGQVAHGEWSQSQLAERDETIDWFKSQVSEKDDGIKWLRQEVEVANNSFAAASLENNELRIRKDKYNLLEDELFQIKSELNLASARLSELDSGLVRYVFNRFKQKIYRTPFGRAAWLCRAGYRRLTNRVVSVIHSPQSALALRDLTERRRLKSFPDSSIVNSLDKDELPEITISVVTYNSEAWLADFMDSLQNQQYPLSKIHLFFVDNASQDNTFRALQQMAQSKSELFAQLEVFSRPNKGFGSGHDYAIKKAVTDTVLVSNVDIKFLENTLSNLVRESLLDETDVASWETRQMPYEHPKYVDPVTLEVNWSSHACVLLSREKYLLVGGYEKRIFMYGEDVEISYRFRREGYRLRYVPTAVVMHFPYAENKIKPLQFSGSTVANFCIRLRYGSFIDILGGVLLQIVLLFRGGGFSGSRWLVIKHFPRLLVSTPAYLMSRKRSNVNFPFHGFDYEMIRDGSFYTLAPLGGKALPLITVITRTIAGRAGLLRQCLLSVINQTYPNIEHIVVEDGGDTARKLIDMVSNNCRSGYSVVHLPVLKNGRSFAANRALEASTGHYLMFLDDDDLLMPDHIEVLFQAIIREKSDAAYSLAWDVITQYEDKELGKYDEISHATLPLFHQPFNRETLRHHNYLPIQAVLFSRSLYDCYGGFEEDLTHLEDWVLWKKYAQNSTFTFVKKTTSMYRTPSDVGHILGRKKQLDDAYEEARQY